MKRAFTLIELLVVIAIIAILAVIVFVVIAVAGGAYYYGGIASTRSGRDTSRGMNVQASGKPIPQQTFVPHAQ